MKHTHAIVIGIATALMAGPVLADYQEDVGLRALQNRLGAAAPDGSGVLVTQAEAERKPEGSGQYLPNDSLSQFTGKTISDQTNLMNAATSSHATTVARRFYGNTAGIAQGVTKIHAYLGGDFFSSGYLNTGTSDAPASSTRQVANHSYVGSFKTPEGNEAPETTEAGLMRLDYVVDTDDYVQVAGLNNDTPAEPLVGDAYNAIAVGVTKATHPSTTAGVSTSLNLYTGNRPRPHIVAPAGATSFATPQVAGAVSLLEQTGANGTYSNGSYTSPRSSRTIQHAQASEVIKAVTMVGASRRTNNTSVGADITDYQSSGHVTGNGLDTRYGAGQLNVLHNHQILTAGEQEPGVIESQGWDYNSSFNSQNPVSYAFTPENADQTDLFASLVWNLDVKDGDLSSDWDPLATLYDLDLSLFDTDSGTRLEKSASTSGENTENIFYEGLTVGDAYELRVDAADGQDPFTHDYALAWNIPEPATGLVLAGLSLIILPRSREDQTRV